MAGDLKKLCMAIVMCLTTWSAHAVLWGDTVESKIDVVDGVVDSNNSMLDVLESKIDVIDQEISIIDSIINSGTTYLTSADIVSGNITLSSSGNYTLAESLTTDITISGGCITLDLNDLCITGTLTISGDDVTVQKGTLLPPAGSPAGIAISSSNRAMIDSLTINCASALTGSGCHGVSIVSGTSSIIENSTIIAGAGGTDSAAEGGSGIALADAQDIVIRNCLISAGDGGGNGSTGGVGGHGISVFLVASTKIEIAHCTIFRTGIGGNGSVANGNGGHGIQVISSAIDVSVHNCIIRNTGAAGSGGGSAGVAGKAIDDNVAAGVNGSIIFGNFAHNIANATKYDLQNSGVESGFALSNPPSSTAVSIYANVFTP